MQVQELSDEELQKQIKEKEAELKALLDESRSRAYNVHGTHTSQ